MNCSDCGFAYKSGNDDFVYCRYWQRRYGKSDMVEEDFINNIIFEEESLDSVGLGWGYPHRHFSKETHWVSKGTATEGLMYSNQICVQKDSVCSNYKDV